MNYLKFDEVKILKRPDIKKVLDEARKLVKFFKFSTVRNPILQKTCFGSRKENIKLDCKT
jgi:hypothetical protein